MKKEPFWVQKTAVKRNREEILTLLYEQPLTFTELRKKSGLSKPVLSKHLTSLKEKRRVEKILQNEKVVYQLSKGAYNLPTIQNLYFENALYLRIQTELTKEEGAFIRKDAVTYQDENRRESFVYRELDPKFIREKSAVEIVEAIDKWLTPIVLFAILLEKKTEKDGIKATYGLIQKLKELVKQKGDLSQFEKVLREKYSDRMTRKYAFIPTEQISVVESLEDIIENLKVHEELAKMWEKEHLLSKEVKKS
jgi:DNA-binding transcriptional ArsR family regulator